MRNSIKNIVVGWVVGMGVLLGAPLAGCLAQSMEETAIHWPGTNSQWHGFERFDFEVDGRKAYVVQPSHFAPGRPWVWRARFPNFHIDTDLILLERGFSIAHLDTDGMLGSPKAMEHWDAFYEFLIDSGLSKRFALEGVSRGGLFVYGFASRWPERVACIYCDTPVGSIASWPGGKGEGRGHDATWKECLDEYGLTEQTAGAFQGDPIDNLAPIAQAGIPILHIVSLSDQIVPPKENTFVLAQRYRKLGGSIRVLEVEKGTLESGGHHFSHPDPIGMADFIECHASAIPHATDYFVVRGSLDNCRLTFEKEKKGRVVFLGGSITTMSGWRDQTADYLRKKFPETEFEFVDAGIASTGSTPAAFRLIRDVFSDGDVDLLFEEAAVNDLHNRRTPSEMIRGMEGIVRHARAINPQLDIVMMHFADPQHLADYRAGKTPVVIEQHELVAEHYDIPSINLAREVVERIDAGQFDWEHDFRNCHPAPMGHRLYGATIRRLLNAAWHRPETDDSLIVDHSMPDRLDRMSYDRAKIVPMESAMRLVGFHVVNKSDPRENGVGGNVRPGYYDVPMLVGTEPGDGFSLKFKGRAVGLFVAAGPDAGTIEYSIDGGAWQQQDLFTPWSKGLHIPWVYVLAADLVAGESDVEGASNVEHELRVRICATSNEASSGTVCRIVNLLVNE